MTLVFTFDSVIYETQGQLRRIPRNAVKDEFSFLREPVQVLVTGVVFEDKKTYSKTSSGQSNVYMEQSLPGGGFSLAAMPVERIREIFSLFPGNNIACCAPYGLAVAQYFVRHEQGIPDGVVMVLEEICGLVLLTVIEDGRVVETREFPSLETAALVEELHRSARLCTAVDKRCIISNHPCLEQISAQTGWRTRRMDAGSPGLLAAGFWNPATGFLPPEELSRRETSVRRRRSWVIGALVAGTGCLLVVGNLFMRQHLGRLESLRAELSREVDSQYVLLRSALAQTYQERLRRRQAVNLDELFYQLIWNMPPEWTVASLQWRADAQGGGHFGAVLVVRGEGSFGREGLFHQRKLNRIFQGGRPAVEVSVRVEPRF
jgi:hypothetical protein